MVRKIAIAIVCSLLGVVAAIATISSSLNSVTVAGTGVQTVFSFPFVGVGLSDISVIYTDSSGNQTTLTQGPGTTQYQVSLNAAVPPALWGVGGAITYNPSGTPIAANTTLTIVRTLPYVQLTSLQNQASFGQLAQATEMALDQLEMQIQQISNGFARVLQAPVNDPSGLNYTLPQAAQRANTGLAFDALGNVIAGTLPTSGIISTPMQPVVSATSLAAARTALGLGSAATGTVNYGLQQGVSGTGLVDVNSAPVQDAVNQPVTAAFHQTQRICTGPITYTLPRANTTWAGFGFWVYAVTGTCTITPNVADNFLGLAGGVAIAVPPGSWVHVTTSAAATGTWWADYHGPSNAKLVAGVGASALTLTLYSGPLQFRDTTLANGDPVWSLPANGISITIPSTATLGTANNVPFRVWVFVAYHSGTPILGVAVCSASTAIYPCASWQTQQKTGVLISTGATSAGALYTSAATSNDSVVIVGYAEYAAGLASAGAWASAPTTLQLCLTPRRCANPGDVVQRVYATTSSATSVSSTAKVATNLTAPITVSSPVDPVLVSASGAMTCGNPTVTQGWIAQIYRNSGSVAVGNLSTYVHDNGGGGGAAEFAHNQVLDTPTSSNWPPTQYGLYISLNAGTTTYTFLGTGASIPSNSGTMVIEEIMGAIDAPANDNDQTQLSKAA